MTSVTMTVRWEGEVFTERLRGAIAEGLSNSAIALADSMVRIFGSDHGGVPSKPGEPPHTQTGHLRNSIGYVPATADRLSAYAGTDVDYGRFLNDGTIHIAPRPWLIPSLRMAEAQMHREFVSTVRAKMSAGGAT